MLHQTGVHPDAVSAAMPIGVVVVDLDHRISWMNARAADLLGCDPADLLDQPVVSTPLARLETDDSLMLDGPDMRGPVRMTVAGEQYRSPMIEIWIRCAPDDPAIGGFVLAIAAVDDGARGGSVDRLDNLRGPSLHRAVFSDPLTGVGNRAHLAELQHLVDPGADLLGALYIDLDGFKSINDRFGHGVGDRVLVAVAERLVGGVRSHDEVIRLGGDEFLIICRRPPGMTAVEIDDPIRAAGALERIARRLVASLAVPITVTGCEERGERITIEGLGASIGVGVAAQAISLDALIATADRSMYRHKRRG